MGERTRIEPYRMNQLMDVAGKVMKQMITGTWHLTYDEMEVILRLIQCGIDESKRRD